MNAFESLRGKKIESAVMCPLENCFYVMDSSRQFYVFRPDSMFIGGKSRAHLMRATNTAALVGATVEALDYIDDEELMLDKVRATFSESQIKTSKGVCTIISVLIAGVKSQNAPLICERLKGFPPGDAVAMFDFMCSDTNFKKVRR